MICALLLLFVPACFYLLFQKLFCFSRDVTEVIGMVRRVDEREFDDLLDKTREDILHANSSAMGFRQEQRARAWLQRPCDFVLGVCGTRETQPSGDAEG